MFQKRILHKLEQDNMFHWVLQPEHVSTILQELHRGVAWRHLSFDITMRKILDVSYWWPMMNQNVYEYYQTCDQCQRTNNLLTQNLAKFIATLSLGSHQGKSLQRCRPRVSPRITFHAPRSARECEGMNPHTFTLGHYYKRWGVIY